MAGNDCNDSSDSGDSVRRAWYADATWSVADRTVDLANLGTMIRGRREALGLTHSRLPRFSGLSL